MKKILVPTDLSPLANQALDVAATLARQYGAELVLLHYVPFFLAEELVPSRLADTALDYLDQQVEEAEIRLQALCQLEAYRDLTITPLVMQGAQGLYGSIARQPVDLIVVASHGATGLQEWLWGSNAEEVANHATCPVLVIKESTRAVAPKKPVCALDIDKRLNPKQLWPFFLPEGIREFVYVMTPTDARVADGVREWMAEWAVKQGLTDYHLTVFPAKTVPDGILHFAETASADLLVIYTHQRSGFWELLSGHVAENIINHATLPVLVMPVR